MSVAAASASQTVVPFVNRCSPRGPPSNAPAAGNYVIQCRLGGSRALLLHSTPRSWPSSAVDDASRLG
jgi:hypothetical protein